MKDVNFLKVFLVPVKTILTNDYNPNEMSEDKFNNLVADILENGFVEPIKISPAKLELEYKIIKGEEHDLIECGEGSFVIVDGEHRFKAIQALGKSEIPCYIVPLEEDQRKFQTIRWNVTRGKMSAEKFTKLFDEMAPKYGKEMTSMMMGFTEEEEFEDLYQSIKATLPDELKSKLDETKEEIKDIQDLSRILNELFATYGETLDSNYMVFEYGGQELIWIKADKELYQLVKTTLEMARDNGESAEIFFKNAITNYVSSN